MYKYALLFVCSIALAQSAKNYKDSGEYDLVNAVIKDLDSNAFPKALTDLDSWSQKYAATDFKDERQFFYVLAYSGTKQPDKTIESATPLLNGHSSLDDAKQARLLYTVVLAIQQVSNPTAAQLTIGTAAARELASSTKIPDGVTREVWAQLESAARGALLYIDLVPGTQALHANDCRAAEAAFRKTLTDFPESAQAAGYLGQVELCLQKTEPERASLALYELARAASLDPAEGMADPKWQRQTVEPALEKLYASYHGDDADGLKQLKDLAVQSPLPPEGFSIKSRQQIDQEKQADFEGKNPELALWARIRAALTAADGEQYFEMNLKDALVPQLRGVVLEAKPACRSTELRIAVPLPDQPLQAEIALKLAKPLAGKPELNREIRWEGVAIGFEHNPFLLTMEAESAKIQGLVLSPCARK